MAQASAPTQVCMAVATCLPVHIYKDSGKYPVLKVWQGAVPSPVSASTLGPGSGTVWAEGEIPRSCGYSREQGHCPAGP